MHEDLYGTNTNQDQLLDADVNQEIQDLYNLGLQTLPQNALHLQKYTVEQELIQL